MEKIEIRLLDNNLNFEEKEDGLYVEGIVNKTEQWSHELGLRRKFVEKITRGAFQNSLNENENIDFLCEHDRNKLLATTQNGSLELFEDEQGLKMRARIIPTSYGKDTYELLKCGVISNMSFGFKVVNDKWTKRSNGVFERVVDKLKLYEVSAVRNPAYPKTAISARGLELIEDVDIPDEVRNEQQEQNNETLPTQEPSVEVSNEKQEEPKQEDVAQLKVDISPYVQDFLKDVMAKLDGIDTNKINEIYEKVVVTQQTKEEPQVETPPQEQVVEKPDLSKYYNMLKENKELK